MGLDLSKPGDPVRIRQPIKKRLSETDIVKSEVVPRSFTVLTSSSPLLQRNRGDLLKIRKMDVAEESEVEQSPLSDNEPEQGPILPMENQRNREMQLDSTEQDNAGQLWRSAQTMKPPQKNEPINRKFNFYFKRLWKKNNPHVCRCNLVITSYSPWVELFNDATPEIETKVPSLSPHDFSK